MKGDAQVIAFLQAQLKNELTAINQYCITPRVLGSGQTGQKEYERIHRRDETRRQADGPHLHARRPAQPARTWAKLMISEVRVLACDLKLESAMADHRQEGIALRTGAGLCHATCCE
jgi:bacterioferritin